jgi:hypothetical protein
MHRRASFCAVFRYARPDIRGLAGQPLQRAIASFLAFGARQRSWVFCAPRRFVPADGCRAVSGAPGPHVVSVVARPTRLIFVGLDRIAWWRRPIQDCQRDVRLLGFAPVCDPHPAAFSAAGSILPRALPLAGFSGACLRMRSGSTPTESPASGIPRARSFVADPRVPIRSWVFSACADCEPAKSRPFSVLMGLMPCRPERLRGPLRANSLSEVLHRP